jgi:hypothetical protein
VNAVGCREAPLATWQFDLLVVPGDTVGPPGARVGNEIPAGWWRGRDAPTGFLNHLYRWLGSGNYAADSWGKVDGTCANVSDDEETGLDICVRIDVREDTAHAVQVLCAHASEAGLKFYLCENGRVTAADENELSKAIAKSRARRFVTDPRGFLDSIRDDNEKHNGGATRARTP